MSNEQCRCAPLEFLRLQSWLSPAFPTGSYSYFHRLEWAIQAGHIYDRANLVDWLQADLYPLRSSRYKQDRFSPLVGANLAVMEADALRMRVKRPFVFTNLKGGEGADQIAKFVIEKGGLAKESDTLTK
jgi:hypothetical protein